MGIGFHMVLILRRAWKSVCRIHFLRADQKLEFFKILGSCLWVAFKYEPYCFGSILGATDSWKLPNYNCHIGKIQGIFRWFKYKDIHLQNALHAPGTNSNRACIHFSLPEHGSEMGKCLF